MMDHIRVEGKTPNADVSLPALRWSVELNTSKVPRPKPHRNSHVVPEEKRRAADLAAVRNHEIRLLSERCIVDDSAVRASVAEMVLMCRALGSNLVTSGGGGGGCGRPVATLK